jgi:AcrR family transcriptional regulator
MAKIKPAKNTSKKEVIIKNAAVLFRTRGFNAASMRELADAVGVEAPSLYNHIGGKSELLQIICFKVADAFNSQLTAIENKPLNAVQKTEAVIRFHTNMMLQQADEVFVSNHEWKYLQEPIFSNFLNQRRSYEKRLVAIIEEGIKEKELKHINPYVIVLAILSAVRGLEILQSHKKNIITTALENDMVALLLNGIVK